MKYDHISFCGPLCKMFILASASLSKVNSTPKRYLKSSTHVIMQMHHFLWGLTFYPLGKRFLLNFELLKNCFQAENFLIYVACRLDWRLFVWFLLNNSKKKCQMYFPSKSCHVLEIAQRHCESAHMTLVLLHCCCCWAISTMYHFCFSSGFWLVNLTFRLEVISPPLAVEYA